MPVDAKFDLRKLNKIQREAFKEGLSDGAADAVDLASQFAPKETEDLSKSGKYEVKGYSKVLISFGNDLPDGRAPAQEYGTYDMPAQPYLGPAIKEIDFAKSVADAFERRLK